LGEPRVVIVGLDGATFDLIGPLVEANRLPTVARLLERGVRGRLMSTVPPATIPAWPTFMTGRSPAQHGVMDFYTQDDRRGRRLVSSRDIDGPTLWRYLSAQGRRSIVVNVPCTYPPESIDGVLLSGMLTPAGRQYASPPEITAKLDVWTGGYRVNPRFAYVRSPFDRDALIRELHRVSEIQTQAFLKLLETERWDFAMLVYRATDIIQHKLWHQPGDIAEMHTYLDRALERIVARVGAASVWLISDHGFGPQEKVFHINRWLRDQGWLAIRRVRHLESISPRPRMSPGVAKPAGGSSAGQWLVRAGLSRDWARAVLPEPVQSFLRRLLPLRFRRLVPRTRYAVDWTQTQVFSDSSFTQETQALRINLRGREPGGIVEPEEYGPLRDRLIQGLKELRDPDSGQTVVVGIHKGEELFAGPYVHRAPDLILQLRDGYKMRGDFVTREHFSRLARVAGCHRPDGILIAAGQEMAAGVDVGEVSIADVMPTVLHLMRLAVPTTCDGQVQSALFAPGSEPARRRVAYQPVMYGGRKDAGELAEDDEEVLSRLRALGYIA
jgi:predicted AlkP superfamily phosphohydrolase/phosphomutase